MPTQSRERIVWIAQHLIDATLPEEEEDALVEELQESVPHPRVTDLIFYTDPPLTADQVVDQALTYRPIEL